MIALSIVPSTDLRGQFTGVRKAVVVHIPLPCTNFQCKLLYFFKWVNVPLLMWLQNTAQQLFKIKTADSTIVLGQNGLINILWTTYCWKNMPRPRFCKNSLFSPLPPPPQSDWTSSAPARHHVFCILFSLGKMCTCESENCNSSDMYTAVVLGN